MNAERAGVRGLRGRRETPGNGDRGSRYGFVIAIHHPDAQGVVLCVMSSYPPEQPEQPQKAPEPPVAVDVQVDVGRRPNGEHWVSMSFTVSGIATYGVVFPPSVAKAIGPSLAKELISAAEAAEAEDRRRDGLAIVRDLPDSLRK